MRTTGNSVKFQKVKKMLTRGLAVLLAVSLVMVSPMQGAYAGMEPASVKIDVGDLSTYSLYLIDGVIVLPEGRYELTGDNTIADKTTGEIPGDISICVKKGVSVELCPNNLNLVNSSYNGFDSDQCPKDTKPALIIEGKAIIHPKGNSTIKGISDVVNVTGKLTVATDQWSNGAITIDSSDIGEAERNYLFNGSGEISINGGSVTIIPASGKSFINCNISFYEFCTFDGEAVMCEGTSVYAYRYCVPENLNADSISVQDMYGNDLVYYDSLAYCNGATSDKFPKSASLLQFSRQSVNQSIKYANLFTDENGIINKVWLPSDCKLFIADGSTNVLCYEIENKESNKAPVPAHLITLMNAEGSSALTGKKTYYAAEGDKLTLLPEDKYIYTYVMKDGTYVTDETVVGSKDMEISVIATKRADLNITVYGIPDEEGQSTAQNLSIPYGYSLSQAGINVPCYIEGSYNILLPYNGIVEELTLHEIGNVTVNDNDNLSFTIHNKAEAEQFAKLVSNNSKTINGTLEADIELDNEGFDMIGSNIPFKGTFDGKNHTVTLHLDKDTDCVGLFAKADSGAKIKDVNVTGTVKGNAYVGGLVGKVVDSAEGVEISGCTNSADVTAALYEVGGIVGRAGKSKIDCCVNKGTVATTSDNTVHKCSAGAIAGNSTYQSGLTISNCIDVSDSNLTLYSESQVDEAFTASNCYTVSVESAGVTKKSESAFKSGEVTYLLNSGMGETKWFQTCGEGVPSPYGDAASQTVYAGYADCYSDEYTLYSNDSETHTEKGHKDKGEYSYSNGKIEAGCRYCDELFTAEVSIPKEKYGSSLKAVTVVCSEDWKAANYPEIVVEYAADPAGVFTSAKPETVGKFYLKALIGTQEIGISDTYTIYTFDTENWVSDENSHWHAATCEDIDEVIDKAAHTWDAGRVTEEATVSSTGIMTYTCSVCKAEKTAKIPRLTPTQAPTEAPTEAPTQAPTGAPTQAPTETPAQVPTSIPAVPTAEEPSHAPENENGTEAGIPESFIDSIKLTKSERKAVENGAEIKLEVSVSGRNATKTEEKNAKAAEDEISDILANAGIIAVSGTKNGNEEDAIPESSLKLTVGPTFTVNMTKQIGDGEKKAVKTNGNEASFTVSIPVSESLLNTDDSLKRLYFMVSTKADGTQNVVPAKLDAGNGTLSFNAFGNGKVTLVTTDVAFFEERGTKLATSAKLNANYVVSAPGSNAGQAGEVGYTGPQKNKASLTVKDSVKINGITYKITSIDEGAFAGNKKLKKLTIGKNISFIGAGAFMDCSNLKEITIKSKNLKAKNLSAEAFEGLSEDVVIYVPAKKLKAYTTMFKKLGVKAELKAGKP